MDLNIGRMPHGPRNSIADVSGVRVGHCTVDDERHKTGVTVILPCEDDIFRNKMPAAYHVLNGFGKTTGLMQIGELGTLETPIALTNTLNVGLVHDAMVEYMCRQGERRGYPVLSVNPVVCECNDASLNDIRHRAVGQAEVFAAIAAASADFAQGDVGAGKGMTCHDLKGGIGSSSRLVEIGGETFTVGVLVLTNHGCLRDLTVGGENIGKEIERRIREDTPDEGSCIMIVGTDLPVTSRQLGRIIRRCSVGACPAGQLYRPRQRRSHGRAFHRQPHSRAGRLPELPLHPRVPHNDKNRSSAFRAVASSDNATEEAVLRSMLEARRCLLVTGFLSPARCEAPARVEYALIRA